MTCNHVGCHASFNQMIREKRRRKRKERFVNDWLERMITQIFQIVFREEVYVLQVQFSPIQINT